MLATCNRVEVYADTEGFHAGVDAVSDLLSRLSGVPLDELKRTSTCTGRAQAVLHLFQVACGLDSMVVGESQILGQLRRAYATARDGGAGPTLHELFQKALQGRQARAQRDRHRPGRPVAGHRRARARRRRRRAARRPHARWSSAPARWARSPARRCARAGAGEVVVANRTAGHRRSASPTTLERPRHRARRARAGARRGRRRRVVDRRHRASSCRATLVERAVAGARRPAARDPRPRAAARRRPAPCATLPGVTLVDLEAPAGAARRAPRPAPTSRPPAAIVAEEVGDFLAWQRAATIAPDGRRAAQPRRRGRRRRARPARRPAARPRRRAQRAEVAGHRAARRRQAAAHPDRPGEGARRRARGAVVRRRAARAVRPRPRGARRGRDGAADRAPSRSRRRRRRGPAWLTRRSLRLGTRGSALALAQSGHVADALSARLGRAGRAGRACRPRATSTRPPSRRSAAPASSSPRCATRCSPATVDLAVHSYKDLPTAPADGLVIAAVPPREDPRDVLVARDGLTLGELPAGARVGTGSPAPHGAAARRSASASTSSRSAATSTPASARCASGELDAVVLARAGLARLGRLDEATEVLDPLTCCRRPAQGALAVECRADDAELVAAARRRSTTPTPAPRSPPSARCSPRSRPAAPPRSGRSPRSPRATTGSRSTCAAWWPRSTGPTRSASRRPDRRPRPRRWDAGSPPSCSTSAPRT